MASKNIVACSECFKNEGLRIDAGTMGIHDFSTCPRCEACDGKKLNRDGIEKLARSFFVNGSYHKTAFGGAPILNLEKYDDTNNSSNPPIAILIYTLIKIKQLSDQSWPDKDSTLRSVIHEFNERFSDEDLINLDTCSLNELKEFGESLDDELKKAIQRELRNSLTYRGDAWCIKDKALLEDLLNIKITFNAPHECQVGITDNLENLRQGNKHEQIISEILESYPIRELTTDDKFYRLRNLEWSRSFEFDPADSKQFDSPPRKTKSDCRHYGRFDSPDLSVLYGSPELETCLHECRVTKEQDLFVATLKPTRSLKLLDLCVFPDETDTDPYESIDHTVTSLFEEASDSYQISRKIALEARNKGFDGVIYPSFYSNLHNGEQSSEPQGPTSKFWVYKNIGIFGKPIQDKRLLITCINRMHLQEVDYTFYFGPADPSQTF